MRGERLDSRPYPVNDLNPIDDYASTLNKTFTDVLSGCRAKNADSPAGQYRSGRCTAQMSSG